eukprot:2494395-Pleurochrysis_carterae.AAC.1
MPSFCVSLWICTIRRRQAHAQARLAKAAECFERVTQAIEAENDLAADTLQVKRSEGSGLTVVGESSGGCVYRSSGGERREKREENDEQARPGTRQSRETVRARRDGAQRRPCDLRCRRRRRSSGRTPRGHARASDSTSALRACFPIEFGL